MLRASIRKAITLSKILYCPSTCFNYDLIVQRRILYCFCTSPQNDWIGGAYTEVSSLEAGCAT
jgi:hypothetical protein